MNNVIRLPSLALIACCLAAMSAPVPGQFVDELTTERGVAARVEWPRGNLAALPLRPDVVTEALDTPRLLAEDLATTSGPIRSGVVQDVDLSSDRDGRWILGDDGGWSWVGEVRVSGALGARACIEPWPPTVGQVFVHDPSDASALHGPFDGQEGAGRSGRFWTPIVYGETIRVELSLPPGTPKDASRIRITAVVNQYRGMRVPTGGGGAASGVIYPCHLDVACFPDWAETADAVGAISFVSDRYQFYCTGAMLGRVPDDKSPLFMTARHCGITQANVESVLVTWFYQTGSCLGILPDVTTLPQTPALALLVEDPATDFLLLGLSSANLDGVTFAGWDASPTSQFAPLTGIHHPGGTHKRITFGSSGPFVTSCIPALAFEMNIDDGDGILEPGSSGSPVFDSARRMRGVLSCAGGDCSGDVLGQYGRLSSAYSKLEPFLNPENTVYVNGQHGGPERGTFLEPFDTIVEGVFALPRGHEIVIVTGSYDEAVTFDKPMTITTLGPVTIGE